MQSEGILIMKKGILYWITGLSGAGKTTIGNRLFYKIKPEKENTVILDGDILKKIAGKDLGYTREERLERAYRYCSLCKLLTNQGINVIICTIAMFDEIRNWNRENIENYVEVFLDVGLDILKERDQKGLYSKGGESIAGIDVQVEFPKNPDIIIKNEGKQHIDEGVDRIINYQVIPKRRWNRDEAYWNDFYEMDVKEHEELSEPTYFAKAMFEKYMTAGKTLIELGCGNGRDSLWFAEMGLQVTGLDISQTAIKKLQSSRIPANCMFICEDFVNVESIYQIQYDYCYSRFTLHAINEQQEQQTLLKVSETLKEQGYFFIEARSVRDGKYGAGKKVERNAYIFDGHYRRFLVLEELVEKLEKLGFEIIEKDESDRFAPQNGEHAVCIRVVAKKCK